MIGRRREPSVLRRRRDGDFDLVLAEGLRDGLRDLLSQLDEMLAFTPDDPALRRLHPPAYLEDADHDAAYQILAGEELRTSQREAVDAVRSSLERDRLTEGEMWQWLRALNALRLVVGTRLGIDDDLYQEPDLDDGHPDLPLWGVYRFTTVLQYEVIQALG